MSRARARARCHQILLYDLFSQSKSLAMVEYDYGFNRTHGSVSAILDNSWVPGHFIRLLLQSLPSSIIFSPRAYGMCVPAKGLPDQPFVHFQLNLSDLIAFVLICWSQKPKMKNKQQKQQCERNKSEEKIKISSGSGERRVATEVVVRCTSSMHISRSSMTTNGEALSEE